MIPCERKLPWHSRVIALFVWFTLLLLPFGASAAAPAKIVILPFQVTSGEQEKELLSFSQHADRRIRSALGLLGGAFTVADEPTIEKLLKRFPSVTGDDQARAAAAEAGADLVVYGFLLGGDSQFQFRGVMWDMRAERANVSIDLKVSNIHALPGVLEVFVKSITRQLHGSPNLRFYKAQPDREGGFSASGTLRTAVDFQRQSGPWISPEIQGALSSVDMGDMDGDGRNETVFIDKSEVSIRRFENSNLRTLTQFSESPATYLSAEVEDLDGDGVAELVLTYQTPSGLESAIVRYVNRNFKVIARLPHTILRTVEDPENQDNRILIGQRTDVADMFSGEMKRYELVGNELTASGKALLPPGTLLFSYVSGRLGKDRDLVRVILNQEQRLTVFDSENRLLCTALDRIYGVERRISIPAQKGQRTVALPGRLLIADTDGDGENELLLIKQRGQTSVIQGLSWDGAKLSEKWRTVGSNGIISDFRIRDFKNEGIPSLVLILIKPDPFVILTGPRSVVYAYDLIP
jgi:hypothetical protein